MLAIQRPVRSHAGCGTLLTSCDQREPQLMGIPDRGEQIVRDFLIAEARYEQLKAAKGAHAAH